MSGMVRNVFFLIMGSVAAVAMYVILFGSFFDSKGTYSEDIWKGALYTSTEAVQTSIAKYYYDYCFIPTIQSHANTDSLLGFDIQTPSSSGMIGKVNFKATIKANSEKPLDDDTTSNDDDIKDGEDETSDVVDEGEDSDIDSDSGNNVSYKKFATGFLGSAYDKSGKTYYKYWY